MNAAEAHAPRRTRVAATWWSDLGVLRCRWRGAEASVVLDLGWSGWSPGGRTVWAWRTARGDALGRVVAALA